MPDQPCPSRRCKGHLEEWATGVGKDGRSITYSICDTCGRTIETVETAPPDHRETSP